jgi:hypothetical protein
MERPPIFELREFLMPSGDSSRVDVALIVTRTMVACGGVYTGVLRETILKNPPAPLHPADSQRFTRILEEDDAYDVLLLVWRHSPFVTDDELKRTKILRLFSNGSLTAYGLATKLAESPSTLAATNTRVRNIALAAQAYGLIERETRTTTNKPLVGTILLHKMVLAIAEEQRRLLAELAPLLSQMNAGWDIPKQ